jgi:acyl carrier protein
MNNIANRVRKIIIDHLHVEAGDVALHARFIEDLGVDSLDAAVLMMAFEEEFNCEIPDDAAETFVTVLDAITFFQAAAKFFRLSRLGKSSADGAVSCAASRESVDKWLKAPAHDALVDELADSIEWDRQHFISKIENSLDLYISRAPLADCLTIIERAGSRDARLTFSPAPLGLDYIEALVAFLRPAKLNGRRLDSALTDPAVSIVVVELERFFFERSEMIARQIAISLAQDKNFLRSVCAEVVGAVTGAAPGAMREQLIDHLMEKVEGNLRDHINSSALTGVKTALTQAIMTAGGAAVSAQITSATAKFMTVHGFEIAAWLAAKGVSQAEGWTRFEIASTAAMACAAAAAGAHMLGARLGVGWGAGAPLLLPPAAWLWLARKAGQIPQKLARAVSTQVAEELSVNFRETTTGVLETAVEQMASHGVSFVTSKMLHRMDMGQFTRDLFKTARKQCAE